MEYFRSLIAKAGQKVQLVADIYPLPSSNFHYVWTVLKGKNIAKVDENGILTISKKAMPGDSFRIKTTAVAEDPFIRPKATIVDYLVQ
ncbi:MAG: hypothetical protein J6T10_09445 [Methanobrevibacter sp.]|nr:hypothetical protein [Methanobrevibacter sp.]